MSLLDFSFEFISNYDCAEVKRICNEMITDQSFHIKSADNEQYRIMAKKKNIFFINSFLPIVKINICENGCGTRVTANFQLRPIIKVLISIFIIVAIAFEICLINLYMQNDLASPFLLLLPLLLALYALVLSYFGLRVMARPIKSRLLSLL